MMKSVKKAVFVATTVLLFSIVFAGNSLDVVVIDAGHGGRDPGTLGVSGVKEKDIVLPIALRFGELVQNAFPDISVIYTRFKDDYPEVRERTVLANREKAKLFISIHANYKKLEETEKKGFEIYLVNKERFPEAIQVTRNENKVIKSDLISGDTITEYIFSSLVQTGYQKYSEILASKLQYSLSEITPIQSRGIMQAGYWVVVGSSMPAVLLECGYLSDASEEQYLSSKEGQEKIAQAMFNAFVEYKKSYELY